MIGSIVWIGPGFAKIRTGGQFVSLWKAFVYVILEAIAWAVLQGPISSGIEMLLRASLIYISGITTAMIGTFFWWFVRALDFKITRDFRWVVPGICYAIAVFNFWSYNFAQPEFSSSDIQLISEMLVVGSLIMIAYVIWRAFGGGEETDEIEP